MSERLIQCVIVLYKREIEDAETFLSLQAIIEEHADIPRRLAVLFYDNSPNARIASCPRLGEAEVSYVHDPSNPGLAKAYQCALDLAEASGLKWLLLLDQDIRLTADFLIELCQTVKNDISPLVGAVVPGLSQDKLRLSPQLVEKYRNVTLPAEVKGVSERRLTAFNAGACVNVSAVRKMGGFPLRYPMEYQDHAFFHYLQSAGSRVYVLGSELEHRLSVLNMEAEMPLNRYEKMLASEWMFVRETGWGAGPAIHRLRLLKRALLDAFKVKNKQYARAVLKAAAVRAPAARNIKPRN